MEAVKNINSAAAESRDTSGKGARKKCGILTDAALFQMIAADCADEVMKVWYSQEKKERGEKGGFVRRFKKQIICI